jgi:hypothetical protein
VTKSGISDSTERLHKSDAVGRREKINDVPRYCRPGFNELREMKLARRSFKEKRHRHVKDVRELLKTAGANAVGALLVLLDLLEGKCQSVRQLRLCKVEHKSSHANAPTHVAVYRVQPLVHECAPNGDDAGGQQTRVQLSRQCDAPPRSPAPPTRALIK